jgi:hypothetical protein
LQAAILTFELADVERALHQQLQGVGVDRLLVEIVGAHGYRLQRVLLIAMPGHDNDFGVRCEFQDFLQCGQALVDAFGTWRQA